jgi:hypothetical protein
MPDPEIYGTRFHKKLRILERAAGSLLDFRKLCRKIETPLRT